MADIRLSVREALGNALDNGYTFDGWTDEQVALDIVAYDADLEDVEPAELVEHIAEWRKEKAS